MKAQKYDTDYIIYRKEYECGHTGGKMNCHNVAAACQFARNMPHHVHVLGRSIVRWWSSMELHSEEFNSEESQVRGVGKISVGAGEASIVQTGTRSLPLESVSWNYCCGFLDAIEEEYSLAC
mmetsp:Transcript_1740/g.6113  ORF Transcript_1740/g.6113 Transcript_1740/m.6113 type:complete len:122 (-) Transcript_1740:636-1001(-)